MAASSPTPVAAIRSIAIRGTAELPATATTPFRRISRAGMSTCATRRPVSIGAPRGSRSGGTSMPTSAVTARRIRALPVHIEGSRRRSRTSSRPAPPMSPSLANCGFCVFATRARPHGACAPSATPSSASSTPTTTWSTSTGPSTSSSAHAKTMSFESGRSSIRLSTSSDRARARSATPAIVRISSAAAATFRTRSSSRPVSPATPRPHEATAWGR